MKNLTASDRASLIKLASSLPKGDETRRAILAGLVPKKVLTGTIFEEYMRDWDLCSALEREFESEFRGYDTWTLDKMVRMSGQENTQKVWKTPGSKNVLFRVKSDVRSVDEILNEKLEKFAQKHHLKLEPHYAGFQLKSR